MAAHTSAALERAARMLKVSIQLSMCGRMWMHVLVVHLMHVRVCTNYSAGRLLAMLGPAY